MAFAQDTAIAGDVADAAPASTIPYRDGYLGLAGFCVSWGLLMLLRPSPLTGAWMVMLGTSLPMLAAELRRAPRPTVRRRQVIAPVAWLVGFVIATVPFLIFHAQAKSVFSWSSAWLIVAPAFLLRFGLEWVRNGCLAGGFPAQLGGTLLSRDRQEWAALAAPARLWALKAVFIPLYGLSLVALVNLALQADLSHAAGGLILAVVLLYTIDLSFGLSGYLFASNDLAPTVRSTQPLFIGWLVCLLCYGPIHTHWPAFEAVVLAEIGWPERLVASPLGFAAAGAMLVLLVLYVSASVVFGLRFSNLANRGVVTAGPYRLMKHPAYFAHAANSWIIVGVLVPSLGVEFGPAIWLVPIAFTILYAARARTEEMHMREDPDYVAYADWIARNGLVARLRRLIGL